MRPGPPRGETATLEVTVTPEMASASSGSLTPTYSNAALVEHVEQVCRQILAPHLEPGEESIGTHVDLTRRSPVPVGATVTLTATVAQVGPQRLVCEVLVRHDARLVGRGSYEQQVVNRDTFDTEVAASR